MGWRVHDWFYGCFFFQAEDGIRDADVTGVQTCALPILRRDKIKTFKYLNRYLYADARYEAESKNCNGDISKENFELIEGEVDPNIAALVRLEIGRASCRERVYISERAGAL